MSLFRRRTIFHAEESLPDPEELKLRFRRRVLLFAALGFVLVLGIPVARDLQAELHARAQTRMFAKQIMDTRAMAASGRAPISLRLQDDNKSWLAVFHAQGGENCDSESTGPGLAWSTTDVWWKLQVQQENGETLAGRQICFHPTKGLLLDSSPIANGKLLVTAQPVELAEEGRPALRPAYLLVGQYGAEIQMVTH